MDHIYERIFSRALDRLIEQVDAIIERNSGKKLKPWPIGAIEARPVAVAESSAEREAKTSA